jgi:phenylacetate-CoA ligase
MHATCTQLRRVERLDEITVVVEARPDADNGVFSACDRDLARHIKGLIGVNATVRTVKPGTVERSLGKAKRVIDLRSKS